MVEGRQYGRICNAEAPRRRPKEPEYKDDDIFYSNQGKAGTCVRHAVAKGI